MPNLRTYTFSAYFVTFTNIYGENVSCATLSELSQPFLSAFRWAKCCWKLVENNYLTNIAANYLKFISQMLLQIIWSLSQKFCWKLFEVYLMNVVCYRAVICTLVAVYHLWIYIHLLRIINTEIAVYGSVTKSSGHPWLVWLPYSVDLYSNSLGDRDVLSLKVGLQ